MLAALLLGILHAASTSIRSLASAAFRSQLTLRQALVDTVIFLMSIAVAVAGGILSTGFRQYIPGFDKYVEVLLTGVVAALAYSYINKWTTSSQGAMPPAGDLLKSIPREHIAITVRLAAQQRVDRELALAILISENMQRPGWMRQLEWASGKASKTHGPFQNVTTRSATTEESIEKAMRDLRGTVLPRQNGGYPLQGRLQYSIEKHNKSRVFVEFCESVFSLLTSEVYPMSATTGADGSPTLRVISRKRVADKWVVLGDMSDDVIMLLALAHGDSAQPLGVVLLPGKYGRRVWRVEATVDDIQIDVRVAAASNPDLVNPASSLDISL
ncbi:hypothetical protein GCM10010464_05330 [Pseudonocardia yunnanensis]